jgi:hypothetical protein
MTVGPKRPRPSNINANQISKIALPLPQRFTFSMKAALNLGLILFCIVHCGCRGLQSEMQKGRLANAPSSASVAGQEMRLEADLARQMRGERFDLVGAIKVSSMNGNLPAGIEINHFALKPSWTGLPGYYVMNFIRNKGIWQLPGPRGNDPNFFANSWSERDYQVVQFTWRNQGGGLGKKPEHFAAYDVSVTVTEADGKRRILSKKNVPTKVQ